MSPGAEVGTDMALVQGLLEGRREDGCALERALRLVHRSSLRGYDQGYGELETGCRSPVAKRS